MSIRFHETEIEGVRYIEIDPIRDERGWFARAWCRDEFAAAGVAVEWVQANLGHNPGAGTLRGMHLQSDPHAEFKLVRCTRGRLQDVAVDLREGSPTFRRWVSRELSADRGDMLLVPPGCAHGYLTLERTTDILYQTSAAYAGDAATGVRHDDPTLGIVWDGPIRLVSPADRSWPLLS